MACWSVASASSLPVLPDGGGSAVRVRAFATNSSDRRRASCTRCCHCSAVSVESGKSSGSCAKQYADDAASDHATTSTRVRTFITTALRTRADNRCPTDDTKLRQFISDVNDWQQKRGIANRTFRNGVSARRLKRFFSDACRTVRSDFAAADESTRMRSRRRGRHHRQNHFEQAAEIQKECFVAAAPARRESAASPRQSAELQSMPHSARSR